jgi:hypothetical protein
VLPIGTLELNLVVVVANVLGGHALIHAPSSAILSFNEECGWHLAPDDVEGRSKAMARPAVERLSDAMRHACVPQYHDVTNRQTKLLRL